MVMSSDDTPEPNVEPLPESLVDFEAYLKGFAPREPREWQGKDTRRSDLQVDPQSPSLPPRSDDRVRLRRHSLGTMAISALGGAVIGAGLMFLFVGGADARLEAESPIAMELPAQNTSADTHEGNNSAPLDTPLGGTLSSGGAKLEGVEIFGDWVGPKASPWTRQQDGDVAWKKEGWISLDALLRELPKDEPTTYSSLRAKFGSPANSVDGLVY